MDRQPINKEGDVIGPPLTPQIVDELEELWDVDGSRMLVVGLNTVILRDGSDDGDGALVHLLFIHHEGLILPAPSLLWQSLYREHYFIGVNYIVTLTFQFNQHVVGFSCFFFGFQ